MKHTFAAIVVILLALSACDISDPRIPTWDVTLTVPLMNERYFLSELADTLNIQVGEDDVLMLTGTGEAETPPFGHVNFTPNVLVEDIPLVSGTEFDINIPLADPEGRVFLTYGKLTQGVLSYLIETIDPANTEVTMQIPTIRTPIGSALELTYDGAAGWHGYDLEECWIGVHNSGQQTEYLEIHFTVNSSQPDGTALGTAGLRIADQIGFSEFEGYLYDYERALTGTVTSINIDYPYDLEEAVQLQQANIFVEVTNEIGFSAELHGEFWAKNNRTGVERTVDILDEEGNHFAVTAATGDEPGITLFNFSDNVSEILQIMPDVIELRNSHILFNGGHDGVPGFVRDDEQVFCTYQVDAPFVFILYDHLIEAQEALKVDISEDNQDLISENILSTDLTFGITNKIPVGGTATVYFSDQDAIDITNPLTYNYSKSINMHSSQYTGPDVDENDEQIIQLSLTHEELQLFTNPAVFMFWTFAFEASDGVITITASPADYVQVKCMLSVGVHVEVEQ